MKKTIAALLTFLLILSAAGVAVMAFSASQFDALPELKTGEVPFLAAIDNNPTYFWPVKFLDAVVLTCFSITALILTIGLYIKARFIKPKKISLPPIPALPEDLNPARAAYFSKGYVENSDFAALIFYWAEGGLCTASGSARKHPKPRLHPSNKAPREKRLPL